ncbi:MAG: tRNA sulfurtransferase, partial [Candidatus Altarchaeaceae archaeon]
MNYIICHYAEIGIKGKNRSFFEKTLKENIEKTLIKNGISFEFVKRIPGKIIIKLKEDIEKESKENKEKIEESLKNIAGIANFSHGLSANLNIEEIKEKALEILSKINFEKFRISTIRSNKNFPLNSQKVNEIVGEYILKNLNKKVDLKNFDVECFIEISENNAFIYTEKINGIGGLPVGTQGNVVGLISGGIDSPVACFLAMKRGCNVIFLHFHSFPYTDKMSIEKVKKIVKILNKFQLKSKIYL